MDLNIRNVPPELIRQLKADAAKQGVTLREYVLSRLGDSPKNGSKAKAKVASSTTDHDAAVAIGMEPDATIAKVRHLATSNWRTCLCEHCEKKRRDLE